MERRVLPQPDTGCRLTAGRLRTPAPGARRPRPLPATMGLVVVCCFLRCLLGWPLELGEADGGWLRSAAAEEPGAPGKAAVLVYRAPLSAPALAGSKAPGAPLTRAEAGLGLSEVARELRQALLPRGLRAVPGAIDLALRGRQARQAHGGHAPEARLTVLLSLREQLAAGRALLGQVELERAEATFAESERRLWEMPLPGEATLLLAETLRWRGVAQLLLKQTAAAEASFRKALALQPTGALTEAEVRPDVVARFREVERALRAEGGVRLRVLPRLRAEAGEAAPLPALLRAGLTLTIDGAEVPLGDEPLERALPPGAHVLTALLPGYQSAAQVVQLSLEAGGAVAEPAQTVTLDLVADGAQTALTALRGAPELRGLAALCQELGLQTVVLASPSSDGRSAALVGQRYQCAEAAATQVVLARAEGALAGADVALLTTEPPALAALPPLCVQLVEGLWRAPLLPLQEQGEDAPSAAERARVVTPPDPREPETLVLLRHPALREARPVVLAPAPLKTPRRTPWYARPWPYLGAAVVTTGVLLGVLLWPRATPQTQVILRPGDFP